MIAAYYITVSLFISTTLITVTLYIIYDAVINHFNTQAISTTMSILTATGVTSDEMTIIIINLYKAQLSLSFGLNISFLALLNNL